MAGGKDLAADVEMPASRPSPPRIAAGCRSEVGFVKLGEKPARFDAAGEKSRHSTSAGRETPGGGPTG